MSNLELWHKVEKTDPEHTKPITGKAYKGNSPKPHYIVLKATETFGPCGIGWGFEIVEEKLLDGALLAPGFYERIHMARIRVWYKWNGERGSVEHVGQTVFSGKRSNGNPFTDEDAPKKSVTDGLVKALSMVGFAGDIFLGRYDDSKYVSELRQEIAEEKRDAAPSRSGSVRQTEAAEQTGGGASSSVKPSSVASPVEVQTDAFNLPPVEEDESKTTYIATCREIIKGNKKTFAELLAWWQGERDNRLSFGLTQKEVDELKDMIAAKAPKEAA